jgi:hypothetical protein
MDKEVLEAWLAEGLSLEAMGERAGRAPSTVSYWLAKHGLTANGTQRHAARGPLPRELLAGLVAEDLTIREIAIRTERSPASVRHWLGRHGLSTTDAARAKRPNRHARRLVMVCPVHGETRHLRRRDGTISCSRCRSASVVEWRRRTKALLVAEAGGACVLCGYDGCLAALEFHHVDPGRKRFAIGGRGLTRGIDALREEAAKCVLLCSNCHVEVEAGVAMLPLNLGRSSADDREVGAG